MYGYIYITTNNANGKKYIGKKKSPTFDNSYFGSGVAVKQAIKKYGMSNFTVELLCECETKDELNVKEKEYISKFNAVASDEFYNIASGGDGGILWESPDKHPSLGKVGRVGKENGMYGKSIFDNISEDEAVRIKNKISNSMKSYYKNNDFVYVSKNGNKKRILRNDIDLYIVDGWERSNKTNKELKVDGWFIGKPCKSCGKPMEKLYGSGLYCSKSCSHKRIRTEQEKEKIRIGRLKYESSLSGDDKKIRSDKANEKRKNTMANKSESEINEMRNNMRNSHIGKRLSKEQREKISESLKKRKIKK